MSTKILKRYQEKAVDELLLKTDLLLEKDLDKRTIVFQSPTGSGKTLMMTEYIEQLIAENEEKDICFLWISIGKGSLHLQSYESLYKEFNGFPDVYLLEREFFGSRTEIASNEVVVVNWEKLRTKDRQTGEWKNILMKDKETTNFRELVRNTRDDRTMIVMIIDESHSSSSSERALELRDRIVKADLTIEMSATPVLREGEYHEKVIVPPNEVVDEGMIKKEIIINENIDQLDDDEITSQELIMQAAFEKREELRQLYQTMDIDINPLVMVQLPSSEAGEEKKDFVESFLADKGITYSNNKLAVWLSEEKVNNESETVTPNDSEVEFLIFKQAIDTGWDCPRASILVRFREIKSIAFEIQTIGRILRMPEALHYENDDLNKGFIFTNLKSFDVNKETYNPNIIKSICVKRRDIYEPMKLKSYYRNRIDFGDITMSFYKVLDETFCQYFGFNVGDTDLFEQVQSKVAEKIDLTGSDNKDEIMLNKPLDSRLFDKLPDERISGREANLFSESTLLQSVLSQEDLFCAFERLIKQNLNGFAFKRSIPTVKQALYRWFKRYLNVTLVGHGIVYVQNVILNNADVFSELFDMAIRAYKPVKNIEILKDIEEVEQWNDAWEIAGSRNLNKNTHTEYPGYHLSLYSPCHLKLDSVIEREFIEYLESKNNLVKWWWQNGNEHMALNFGIKYNRKSTFQPDFIVCFEDGRIGIFDTKASGYNEDDNKLKSDALQQYIKDQNKMLFGGIVIKEGLHFRIITQENYVRFENNPDSWEYLESLVKA